MLKKVIFYHIACLAYIFFVNSCAAKGGTAKSVNSNASNAKEKSKVKPTPNNKGDATLKTVGPQGNCDQQEDKYKTKVCTQIKGLWYINVPENIKSDVGEGTKDDPFEANSPCNEQKNEKLYLFLEKRYHVDCDFNSMSYKNEKNKIVIQDFAHCSDIDPMIDYYVKRCGVVGTCRSVNVQLKNCSSYFLSSAKEKCEKDNKQAIENQIATCNAMINCKMDNNQCVVDLDFSRLNPGASASLGSQQTPLNVGGVD